MKEIKDLMYYHSEILTAEEETTIKYSKARALDAAKYLERFCLYFKLDNPDCQGCPLIVSAAACCISPKLGASLRSSPKR